MFCQNTVAPIADTPNNLYAACSMRGPRVKLVASFINAFTPPMKAMVALLEAATDAIPFFTVRVAYDRLVGSYFNIVREREPTVATRLE